MTIVIITHYVHTSLPGICLQQLQMPRNTINHALRPQNAQHRPTSTRNLRPSSILDHTRTKTQADRLRLEQLQFILRLNLQSNLGLSFAFPAAQDGGVRGVREEVFVAGEGCVRALGGDFTYCRFQVRIRSQS